MGDWLFGSIITGIVLTVGWVFFTEVLPRMAADRAARPPEQPLTQLPGDEHQPIVAVDAETSIASTKNEPRSGLS